MGRSRQARICTKTLVREHMFPKLDLYHKLIRRRYSPLISILLHAIVRILPPTWPISNLHKEQQKLHRYGWLSIAFKIRGLQEPSSLEKRLTNDQMIEGPSIHEHVMPKPKLIGWLHLTRFFVGFCTFINAIITTLPSWWVSEVIDIVKRIYKQWWTGSRTWRNWRWCNT